MWPAPSTGRSPSATEYCEGKDVISEPQTKAPADSAVVDTQPRSSSARAARRPIWRQRRVLAAGLGLLVLAPVVTLVMSSRSSAPPPAATATPTALVAHGQVVPVQQARVGTLGGGQVQQLNANLGSEV